jgi:hypothetical protein
MTVPRDFQVWRWRVAFVVLLRNVTSMQYPTLLTSILHQEGDRLQILYLFSKIHNKMFIYIVRFNISAWLITGFVTSVTRRVPLVEQELLTLSEDLSSPPIFSEVPVTRYLVLCVCFCKWLFVRLSFFIWPFFCLFYFDLRILMTPFGIFKLFLVYLIQTKGIHVYYCKVNLM